MSEVTQITVQEMAKLARLKLSAEEESKSAKDINGIFSNFSKIQKIDTKNIPTSDDVTGLTNITREDQAKPENLCSHEDLLKNAPDTQNNLVKTKAVL